MYISIYNRNSSGGGCRAQKGVSDVLACGGARGWWCVLYRSETGRLSVMNDDAKKVTQRTAESS